MIRVRARVRVRGRKEGLESTCGFQLGLVKNGHLGVLNPGLRVEGSGLRAQG